MTIYSGPYLHYGLRQLLLKHERGAVLEIRGPFCGVLPWSISCCLCATLDFAFFWLLPYNSLSHAKL